MLEVFPLEASRIVEDRYRFFERHAVLLVVSQESTFVYIH
jgi:hypothetical protein